MINIPKVTYAWRLTLTFNRECNITLVHLWSGGELLIHKSTRLKLASISSLFSSCHILSRSISLSMYLRIWYIKSSQVM